MTISSAKARELVRRELRSATARAPELFSRGARLIVGYSGGQDSTALLHALANSHRGLEITAVYVDHALRPDSANTAELAQASAAQIGVRCEVRRVDVAAYRRGLHGWSVQQAARAARYQALASAVEERNAAALIVAHTADDQAETLLLHLTRGTGLGGMAGMRFDETLELRQLGPPLPGVRQRSETLRLARPLLKVSRGATLAYCAQFGLPVVEDASNQTRAYTRNRVRLDVLPVLEQLNPAIRSVLARTADLVAEDEAVLDALAVQVHDALAHDQGYNLRLWRAQPRALQRRVLRLAVALLVGGLVDVGNSPIDDALDLLQTAQPKQTYHLPYGVEVCVGTDAFGLRLDGSARARSDSGPKTWEVDASRV